MSPGPVEDGKTTVDLSQQDTVVNLEASLGRMGNDQKILKQLAAFYLEDVPRLLSELQSAMDSNDSKTTHYVAHSIVGQSSNFDAFCAMRIARSIEQLSREGNVKDCVPLLPDLNREVDKVIGELKGLVSS